MQMKNLLQNLYTEDYIFLLIKIIFLRSFICRAYSNEFWVELMSSFSSNKLIFWPPRRGAADASRWQAETYISFEQANKTRPSQSPFNSCKPTCNAHHSLQVSVTLAGKARLHIATHDFSVAPLMKRQHAMLIADLAGCVHSMCNRL
jgi:hypothetical protein